MFNLDFIIDRTLGVFICFTEHFAFLWVGSQMNRTHFLFMYLLFDLTIETLIFLPWNDNDENDDYSDGNDVDMSSLHFTGLLWFSTGPTKTKLINLLFYSKKYVRGHSL